MSGRPRIPGTHRTELLDALEGEAKMLGLVWAVPGTVLADNGSVVEALVTDDERVAAFFDAHGDAPGRDINTNWATIVGAGEVVALLAVEADDFEAPLLEFAFPLPRAISYIESSARVGSLALCSLPTGRVISFDVASDISVVRAGFRALLFINSQEQAA